jgi:hypothetical protein
MDVYGRQPENFSMRMRLAITIFLFAILGITVVLMQKYASPPNYLVSESNFYPVNDHLCIGVNEFLLWRQGDFGSDLREQIRSTLVITVDSKAIDTTGMPFSGFDLLIAEYNDTGELVGSHGPGFSFCFSTRDLQHGFHEASIEIRDRNGKQFHYEWGFVV